MQKRRHLSDRALPQSSSVASSSVIDLTTPDGSAAVRLEDLDAVKCEDPDAVKVKFEQENRPLWKF